MPAAPLTPAGVPQAHLGADLGTDEIGRPADARTNVGIYNGGDTVATATVEVKRNCDGSPIARATATLPPDSVVQLNGLQQQTLDAPPGCIESFETYVVVTVDQPSFSYVVTLSNEQPPWTFMSSVP